VKARTRPNLIMRTLDPQAKALLDRIAASGTPSYHTLSAVEARKTYKESRKFTQPATPPEIAMDKANEAVSRAAAVLRRALV
jgi:hypothetical protein